MILKMKNYLFALLIPLMLTSCGDSADSRFDSGYSDGYASGYKTACKIRPTMIEGDWDDKNYYHGLNTSKIDGSAACRA